MIRQAAPATTSMNWHLQTTFHTFKLNSKHPVRVNLISLQDKLVENLLKTKRILGPAAMPSLAVLSSSHHLQLEIHSYDPTTTSI
jgi:hypothetical protein